MGPARNIGSGAIISDWIPFTPTGTFTTNTTYTGAYRRLGGDVEIQYRLAFSGAPNATTLKVNMPPGLKYDINKMFPAALPGGGTQNLLFGKYQYYRTGAALNSGNFGSVGPDQSDIGGTNSILILGRIVPQTTAPAQIFDGGGVTNTSPYSIGSGDEIVVQVTVPVLGWGSTGTTFNIDCGITGTCLNTFSAKVSSGGVVSDENVDWINGNCTNATPFVCTFNSSFFGTTPNCLVTPNQTDTVSRTTAASTSSVSVNTADATFTPAQRAFNIICSRQGSDMRPAINAPLINNSVTSSSSGLELINRASITFPGGTPTASSQSGSWISSITDTNTGRGILNLNSGYNGTPSCTCASKRLSGSNNELGFCELNPTSATSVTFQTREYSGGFGFSDMPCLLYTSPSPRD